MIRRSVGRVLLRCWLATLIALAAPALRAVARAADTAEAAGKGHRCLANFGRVLAEAKAAGQPARIVYLGGAVTKGQGASQDRLAWHSLVTAELRRAFPGASFVAFNHAVAGTDSWLGACRAQTDVVQHYLPLALVVVEFAVDDAGSPEARVLASMEGIVRQVRAAHPHADVLFVYAFSKDQLEAFRAGRVPESIAWHERVAAHYGVPSLNVAQEVARQIAAGALKPEDYAADGVHPTDRGHAMFLAAAAPLIEGAKAAAENGGPKVKYAMPAPLSPRPMDKARLVPYEQAALEPGWNVGQESPLDDAQIPSAVGKFRHVLSCDKAGPALSLRFEGDCLGLFGAVGPDSGDLEYSIDGGPWQPKPWFDAAAAAGFRPRAAVLAEGLDPAAAHELRLRVAEPVPQGSKGRTARIGYLLVNGRAVGDPYQGMTPLERIDAIYAGMAPVKYAPPAGRWKHLPKTIEKLRNGPELRIVMLGDSIINDTASSNFELLLERMYPKCKVTKVRSVRGSTGCWWYKEEGRVKEYVLDHKPDLLMIGGISQRDDVESIRDVIRQVRAQAPPVEVMVITPVFGTTDPRTDKSWTYETDPNGEGYRSRLMRMAAEEKVEFFDMTGPWGQYIRESDKARGWFMRDPVHANERGFQILGRILEIYFSPPK